MALLSELVSDPAVLFGRCPHWPRWKSVTVTVALSASFTDGTYNGDGDTDLAGGPGSESLGGTASQDRWPASARDGTALDSSNMVAQEAQMSFSPEDGGLYTSQGSLAFLEPIDVSGVVSAGGVIPSGGSTSDVSVGVNWEIIPALVAPPGPVPPGGMLARGRADGKTHQMICPAAGLGAVYSWGAGSGGFTSPTLTVTTEATGFDPIEFELGDLPGSTFVFTKTTTTTTTYSPPDDDPEIGYYPRRGTTIYTATATVTVVFTP